MCSISGFSISPDEMEVDANLLARELLVGGEFRGRDATGAAWFDGDGMAWTQKDHMKASDWVRYCQVDSNARVVICHTRQATQGSHFKNDNNHPIVVGNDKFGVIGVHNGVVWNDDRLYKRMDLEDARQAEVDSEAIFASILYGSTLDDKGDYRLGKTLTDCLGEIGGSAAVAWIEMGGDPNVLHLSRISSSPLVVATTARGSLVFASTKDMIERGAKAAGLDVEVFDYVKEGTYLKVLHGLVVDRQEFTTADDRTASYSFGGSGMYYGGQHIGGQQSTLAIGAKPADVDVAPDVTEYTEVEGNVVKSYAYKDSKWVLVSTLPIERPGVVSAVEKAYEENDAATRSVDGDFPKPNFSRESVYANLAYTLFEDSTYLDGAAHSTAYRVRQANIGAWAADLKTDLNQYAAVMDECGANLRQGELVRTDLGKQVGLAGSIVALPPSFPEGEYLIRVMMPNDRYHGGFEPILVGRKLGEFVIDATEGK